MNRLEQIDDLTRRITDLKIEIEWAKKNGEDPLEFEPIRKALWRELMKLKPQPHESHLVRYWRPKSYKIRSNL
jgi:hypothetical protein